MKRKVITSALILVILGASAVTSYADYKPFPRYIHSINANQESVEIISPKEDIIVKDSLLISIQVKDNVSVSLTVYKEGKEDEEDTIIIDSEKVDQGESLNFYNKELKDLLPGKYRIVFDIEDQDGNAKEPVIKYFTVKDKKEEMNESLERIKDTKVTNILEDIQEEPNY